MINAIERYTECGDRAGTARLRRDESAARRWKEQFEAMRRRETTEDRQAATAAYNAAYEEAARDYTPIRY